MSSVWNLGKNTYSSLEKIFLLSMWVALFGPQRQY